MAPNGRRRLWSESIMNGPKSWHWQKGHVVCTQTGKGEMVSCLHDDWTTVLNQWTSEQMNTTVTDTNERNSTRIERSTKSRKQKEQKEKKFRTEWILSGTKNVTMKRIRIGSRFLCLLRCLFGWNSIFPLFELWCYF